MFCFDYYYYGEDKLVFVIVQGSSTNHSLSSVYLNFSKRVLDFEIFRLVLKLLIFIATRDIVIMKQVCNILSCRC